MITTPPERAHPAHRLPRHYRRASTAAAAAFALALSLAALVALAGTATAVARPPNVILIFTDDQGTVDLNCYGADDLATPHLDALAGRGVRFTQFYAASPVCSPSRAALLTGRVPHRAGVPSNATSQRGNPAGLPAEEVTLAEVFKAAGYATAHIGKWHLGYVPEKLPNAQGFDYSFGHMGGCIDNFSHFFYWNGPNRHDLWRNGAEVFEDGVFFGDLMLREAVDFMEDNRADPFFIYFAINMPHYPYQGDTRWLEHYRAKNVPYPRDLYAAFLSTIDERVGRLLGAVERLGLSGDTIVVFQSDHGHSTELRAHHGGGSAGPYRGAKFSLLEGGIRVPAIISWPGSGKVPQGEVRNQLGTACDWLPTLANLAGVPLPEGRQLDGKDLAKVIADPGAPSPHGRFHWELGGQWAVREGDWKLVANARDTSGAKATTDRGTRLYFLPEDPAERNDRAADEPERVARMRAYHEAFNRELAAGKE